MLDKESLHKLLGLGNDTNTSVILIFSNEPGNRLNYVCEFIFNHVLKVNCLFTNDIKEFSNSSHFKINYKRLKRNLINVCKLLFYCKTWQIE